VAGASGYVGQELLRLLHAIRTATVRVCNRASRRPASGSRWPRADQGRRCPVATGRGIILSGCRTGVCRYVHEARAGGKRTVTSRPGLRCPPTPSTASRNSRRPPLADARARRQPGMLSTAALLALIPLAQLGLIDPSREVIIDAARRHRCGTQSQTRSSSSAKSRGLSRVRDRQHSIAIRGAEAGRCRAKAGSPRPVFTPHLLPVKRGILERFTSADAGARSGDSEGCTARRTTTSRACRSCTARCRRSKTSSIGIASAIGGGRSRRCRRRGAVIAAIDNLVKGRRGQAIQNMNVMLGLPETRPRVLTVRVNQDRREPSWTARMGSRMRSRGEQIGPAGRSSMRGRR